MHTPARLNNLMIWVGREVVLWRVNVVEEQHRERIRRSGWQGWQVQLETYSLQEWPASCIEQFCILSSDERSFVGGRRVTGKKTRPQAEPGPDFISVRFNLPKRNYQSGVVAVWFGWDSVWMMWVAVWGRSSNRGGVDKHFKFFHIINPML